MDVGQAGKRLRSGAWPRRGRAAALAAAAGLLWAASAGTAGAADAVALGATTTVEPAVLMRLIALARVPAADDAPAGQSGSAQGARGGLPSGEPEAPASSGVALQLSEDLSWQVEQAGEPDDAIAAPAAAPSERGWLATFAPPERDLGLFLAAQASLLIDMAQTLQIRRTEGLYESNVLLGPQPSDEAVVAYFGSIAALHAVAYAVLPGRWANVFSRGVLFVEVPAIDHNARVGIRVQF